MISSGLLSKVTSLTDGLCFLAWRLVRMATIGVIPVPAARRVTHPVSGIWVIEKVPRGSLMVTRSPGHSRPSPGVTAPSG